MPEIELDVGDLCVESSADGMAVGAGFSVPRAGAVFRPVVADPEDDGRLAVAVKALICFVAAAGGFVTVPVFVFDSAMAALIDSNVPPARAVANFPAPVLGLGGDGDNTPPAPRRLCAVFQARGSVGMGGRVSRCTKESISLRT